MKDKSFFTIIRLNIDRVLTGRSFKPLILTLLFLLFILFLLCLLEWICCGANADIRGVISSFFDSGSAWRKECFHKSLSLRECLLPLVNILGALIFGGLVISVITSMIIGQVGKVRSGHISYDLKNHLVVIGFGPLVPALVKKLLDDKSKKHFVEIYTNLDIDQVRDKVFSQVTPENRNRIVFIHSLICSKSDLQRLHTESAQAIYVFGDMSDNPHDSQNMEILDILSEIHKEKKVQRRIRLVMSFESESCFAALQVNSINKKWDECFEFIPYNYYCECADRMLMNRKAPLFPAEMFGCSNQDKHVHLVIIGMSRHGLALAKEAANLLHFSNFDEKTGGNATMVTFIDEHADEGIDFFSSRYHGYFAIAGDPMEQYVDATVKDSVVSFSGNCWPGSEFLDVRFRFIKGNSRNPEVRKWLSAQAIDPSQYLTVAVCTSEWSHSMSSGLFLPEELYYGGKVNPVNIFILQESSCAMLRAINGESRYSNVRPFGMWNDCRIVDDEDMFLPMAIHYLFWKKENEEHKQEGKEELPDLKDVSCGSMLEMLYKVWLSETRMWAQWSNRYRAYFMMLWLQSIGYDLKGNKKFPKVDHRTCVDFAMVEHRRWVMERLFLGFRPANKEEKTVIERLSGKDRKQYVDDLKNRMFVHTLLIPNYLLPESEKSKDDVIAKMPQVADAFKNTFCMKGDAQ